MSDAPVIAAEYTNGSKRRSATLQITRIANGRREYLASYPVTGKAQARFIALKHGATPWNF